MISAFMAVAISTVSWMRCQAADQSGTSNVLPADVFTDPALSRIPDEIPLQNGVTPAGQAYLDDHDAEGITPEPSNIPPPDSDAFSIAPRFFFQGTGAAAFAGPGGMGGAGGGGAVGPRVDFLSVWFPDQETSNGPNSHLGFVQETLSLAAPVWRGDGQGVTASIFLRSEIFDTNVILPDSRTPFPDDLWNVRFGGGYFYKFSNGWTGGVNVQIGSASDQPFSQGDVITETISGYLRYPYSETSTWLFSLNYSNYGQVAKIPIPGVAYFYKPSPDFQLALGFPFASMVWRLMDRWTLEASYALVTTIRTRVSYEITEFTQLYAGYEWLNESYLLADRADDDRFYYYEQRLAVGWQRKLADHVGIDLSGGYAFDRRYFSTDSGFALTGTDLVKVANTPFIALRIHIRW